MTEPQVPVVVVEVQSHVRCVKSVGSPAVVVPTGREKMGYGRGYKGHGLSQRMLLLSHMGRRRGRRIICLLATLGAHRTTIMWDVDKCLHAFCHVKHVRVRSEPLLACGGFAETVELHRAGGGTHNGGGTNHLQRRPGAGGRAGGRRIRGHPPDHQRRSRSARASLTRKGRKGYKDNRAGSQIMKDGAGAPVLA